MHRVPMAMQKAAWEGCCRDRYLVRAGNQATMVELEAGVELIPAIPVVVEWVRAWVGCSVGGPWRSLLRGPRSSSRRNLPIQLT